MMITLTALIFSTLSPSISHAAKLEVYADCANYCAFRDFPENRCHGIAFKKPKKNNDKEFDYLYGEWSNKLNGCFYSNFGLNPQFISGSDVKQKCSCAGMEPLPVLPPKDEPLNDQWRERLRDLRAAIKTWAPCAPDPLTMIPGPNATRPFSPQQVDSCEKMKARGEKPYVYMGGCSGDEKFCTYFGNTMYFSGPLCFMGDMDHCEYVRSAQDPVTGGWYRNAYQRRFPLTERGQSLFSRDEFIGIMLYFVKTRDKVAAAKWMRFIANNPKKKFSVLPVIRVVDICPQLPPKPVDMPDDVYNSIKSDDRCEMRADSWGTMYRVYKHIGFSDSELKKISKTIHRKMVNGTPWNAIVANLSAKTLQAVSYDQGDQATNLLILRAVGMAENNMIKETANVINRRTMYESPYYHWLAMEGKATNYGAALIEKYCPKEMPQYGWLPNGAGFATPAAGYFDFEVHFLGGKANAWQVLLPTGHECIGWINLYLNDQ